MDMEANLGILPAVKHIYFKYALRNKIQPQDEIIDPPDPLWNSFKPKLHSIPDSHKLPFCLVGHSGILSH